LVTVWIHDEDADLANVAAALAREPEAACYALARVTAAALQLWSDDVRVPVAELLTGLRNDVEGAQ
jgi:hypothetical protein